jgi:ADP-ribose pyrophosphatase YjhB (NUDIX family)
MKRALAPLYWLQRRLWRVLKPRTRGVKVMLFNDRDEVLLIRNGYGRSDLFVLPGGGIRWRETPARAAIREVREELGCGVKGLRLRSQHLNRGEGKRDTIFLFVGTIDGAPMANALEVEEARFFPLGELPAEVSPATRRRIEEHLRTQGVDESW